MADDVNSSARKRESHVSYFGAKSFARIASLPDPYVIVKLIVGLADGLVMASPDLGIDGEQMRVSIIMIEHVV